MVCKTKSIERVVKEYTNKQIRISEKTNEKVNEIKLGQHSLM